jgi:hypothetical protein
VNQVSDVGILMILGTIEVLKFLLVQLYFLLLLSLVVWFIMQIEIFTVLGLNSCFPVRLTITHACVRYYF